MKLKAGPSVKCIEFGLRRAQGPNGALTASKYCIAGGFEGSSNVYAGMLYGIPISGTIAHSYIMSFATESDIGDNHFLSDEKGEKIDVLKESISILSEMGVKDKTNVTELHSFVSYACSFPTKFLALVDTFSTLESGVPNFLAVAVVIKRLGYEPMGIRLDSGDLA